MKKLLLTIIISLIIITCCKENNPQVNQVRWDVINLNYSGDFSDIFPLPNDTILILNGLDTTFQKSCIFESDNAGNTWIHRCFEKLAIGGFSNFYCFDHSKIFVGNYRSYDGGNTWQSVGNFKGGLMYFFNKDMGIGISGFTIYKTIDGGNIFSMVWDNVSYVGCQFLQFFDNQIGYASGGLKFDNYNFGLIVKTNDGGNTWKKLPGEFKSIIGMSFIAPDVGYIVVNLSQGVELLKTTNGGNSWISINSKIFEQTHTVPFECYFSDEMNGFICGSALEGSKILSTSDGGKNWKEEYCSPSNSVVLTKMIFTSSDVGYAIGTDGLLLKRTQY